MAISQSNNSRNNVRVDNNNVTNLVPTVLVYIEGVKLRCNAINSLECRTTIWPYDRGVSVDTPCSITKKKYRWSIDDKLRYRMKMLDRPFTTIQLCWSLDTRMCGRFVRYEVKRKQWTFFYQQRSLRSIKGRGQNMLNPSKYAVCRSLHKRNMRYYAAWHRNVKSRSRNNGQGKRADMMWSRVWERLIPLWIISKALEFV